MKIINSIFLYLCIGLTTIITIFTIININPQTPLIGVTLNAEKADLNVHNILYGKWQNTFDQWYSENFPTRNYWVKCYDQILYSTGNTVNNIKAGHNGDLHGVMWIEGYLEQNIDENTLDNYLVNIKLIESELIKRGKKFFYIISPNKAEVYEDTMPWNYKFAQNGISNRAMLRRKLIDFFSTQTEISYFDTYDLMKDLRQCGDFEPFSKTGIHWNQYGGGESLKRILSELENQNIFLPEMECKYTITATPELGEDDYQKLLNVWYSSYTEHYPSASIDFLSDNEEIHVYSMTTSFSNIFVEFFLKYGMPFASYKRLYYNQLSTELYNNNGIVEGVQWKEGKQMKDVDYEAIVSESDLIIIEHNAGELPIVHIEFVQRLADYFRNTQSDI